MVQSSSKLALYSLGLLCVRSDREKKVMRYMFVKAATGECGI